MTILAFMLSNRPDAAMASATRYAAFDRLYIYAHEQQKADFEAAYQETTLSNVEFLYHNIRPLGKQPAFGAIRFHLMRAAQAAMGRRDFAVMVDDDIKAPRWAQPGQLRGGGAQSYPIASSEIFRRELIRVAQVARSTKFYFFTGVPNAMSHNGYRPESPFKAVWRFSQLLGFFHDSPNPFDVRVGPGEDYAAACRLVDLLGTLPFLEHRGLVPELQIISSKYRNPSDPRNVFLSRLQKQYPWLELNNNYRSGVIAPRMNRRFLNALKTTVAKEYR